MSSREVRGLIALSSFAFVLLCIFFYLDFVLLGLGIWVSRFDHRDLVILAYDSAGRSIRSAEFFRTWFPALIVRERGGAVCLGIQHGIGSPRIAVPRKSTVVLEALWPVPGFGKVLLTADNGGGGYSPAEPVHIELPAEFARSRVARVRRWIADHAGGVAVSAQADAKLRNAEMLLTQARTSSGQERYRQYTQALTLAMEAGEEEVLGEARESILRREMAVPTTLPATLGAPGTGHDFEFGVFDYSYDDKTVELLSAMGLNYAVLYMSWIRTEPEKHRFSVDQFDTSTNLAALARNNFTLAAHGVVWFANGEVPPYLQKLSGDADAIAAAVREHISGLIAHYRDRIAIWEACNECNTAWARLGLDERGIMKVIAAAADEIRKDAPRSKILINLSLPLGEDASFSHYPVMKWISSGRIDSSSVDSYQFARDLRRAGITYDILGLQFYNGGYVDVIRGGLQVEYIDIFRLACELDRYHGLAKQLQISEISVGSFPYRGIGYSWWHATSNETTQADFLADALTVAYGRDDVSGINWWDLYDQNSFVRNGGLIDEQHRPKLSYFRLINLMKEWHPNRKLVIQSGSYDYTDANRKRR